MFTFSRMAVRFFQGTCLSLAIAAQAWLAGCGVCAAECSNSLTAEGTVDVKVADSPELEIVLCHDGTCIQDTLTWDQGAASCTSGNIGCAITETSDGKASLELQLFTIEEGLEDGQSVTVKITSATTNVVLVDAKLQIDSLESSELCGSTCDSAVVSWGP